MPSSCGSVPTPWRSCTSLIAAAHADHGMSKEGSPMAQTCMYVQAKSTVNDLLTNDLSSMLCSQKGSKMNPFGTSPCITMLRFNALQVCWTCGGALCLLLKGKLTFHVQSKLLCSDRNSAAWTLIEPRHPNYGAQCVAAHHNCVLKNRLAAPGMAWLAWHFNSALCPSKCCNFASFGTLFVQSFLWSETFCFHFQHFQQSCWKKKASWVTHKQDTASD